MPFLIGFKRARELLYLGDPIDAHTALAYGHGQPGCSPGPACTRRRCNLPIGWRSSHRRRSWATKLAINRGADAAGFRNAIRAGLDVVAPLYAARTEVGATFQEIKDREGLGAALRWRAEQFAEKDRPSPADLDPRLGRLTTPAPPHGGARPDAGAWDAALSPGGSGTARKIDWLAARASRTPKAEPAREAGRPERRHE